MTKTLTSGFVLASLAGYFVVRTVATLANATSITLTSDSVGAGTNQIFAGMYIREAPVGSIAVLRT